MARNHLLEQKQLKHSRAQRSVVGAAVEHNLERLKQVSKVVRKPESNPKNRWCSGRKRTGSMQLFFVKILCKNCYLPRIRLKNRGNDHDQLQSV